MSIESAAKPPLPPAGILELLYTPETLQLHLTENWDREKIESFALTLLGDEYRTKVSELEGGLKKTQLLLLENDELRTEDQREAEDKVKTLQHALDTSYADLRELRRGYKLLEQGYNLRSKELADAQEELQRVKLQVPLEANDVADILSGIIPNRSCIRAGCFGKRGYTGITVDIDPKSGHKKITVHLCCGVVGETEYTRLRRLISADQREQRVSSDTVELLVARVKRYTVLGMVQYGWRWLGAWVDGWMPRKGDDPTPALPLTKGRENAVRGEGGRNV